jgi:hypothetical protein
MEFIAVASLQTPDCFWTTTTIEFFTQSGTQNIATPVAATSLTRTPPWRNGTNQAPHVDPLAELWAAIRGAQRSMFS